MSTLTTTAASNEKARNSEVDEQDNGESSPETGSERGTEAGTTKGGEKDDGEAASGAPNHHQQPSVTYGQQAEDARRAYAQYAAQFGPPPQHLAAHPGLAPPPWAYPPPGGAYYHPAAYIPVGPDGKPVFPGYFVGAVPPGALPPHGSALPPHGGMIPYPPMGYAFPQAGAASQPAENPPRKPVPPKILIACDFCRHRKLRCTGERPTCSVCERSGQQCVYDSRRKTRGPGKKSLMALGIPVTLGKPKKRRSKAKGKANDAQDSAAAAAPPDFSRLGEAAPGRPLLMPMPPASSSGAPSESSALTAAAILNALPALQAAFGHEDGHPYPDLYSSMQSPPMPAPPPPEPAASSSPSQPPPTSPTAAALKTPSPKSRKRKAAANSPPSPLKTRKRARKTGS